MSHLTPYTPKNKEKRRRVGPAGAAWAGSRGGAVAGSGCRAPVHHNHVHHHLSTVSSPRPGVAVARAGRQLVPGPVPAVVMTGGCGVPQKHWWRRVVRGEAEAGLLEGCGPGMAASVAASAPLPEGTLACHGCARVGQRWEGAGAGTRACSWAGPPGSHGLLPACVFFSPRSPVHVS